MSKLISELRTLKPKSIRVDADTRLVYEGKQIDPASICYGAAVDLKTRKICKLAGKGTTPAYDFQANIPHLRW